jgi:two-component system, NarL family, invasion response regulator UvrY
VSRARLLLADDNALVADEIRKLLEPSFDVVGVVHSGEALEAAFEALAPEVIVTDIAMPGEGGLVAVRRIRERHPGMRVVLLTVIDASPMIRVGLSAGAQGYVVKEDAADELVPAVEAALEGRRYVSATGRRYLA